jgi:hypothetical protein
MRLKSDGMGSEGRVGMREMRAVERVIHTVV